MILSILLDVFCRLRRRARRPMPLGPTASLASPLAPSLALGLLACSGDVEITENAAGDVRGAGGDAVADADVAAPNPRMDRATAGLVLGLRDKEGGLSALYVDPGGFTPLGEGLAVPRRDGWWTLQQQGRAQGSWTEAYLVAAPAGAEGAEPSAEEMATCEGSQSVTVLFVGPEHVSVELSSGGYCEGAAHPFAWSGLRTVPLDALPDLLAGAEIGQVVGPMADEAHFLAGEAAREADGGECLEEPNPASWALIRSEGRWIARGGLSHAIEVCRGQTAHYTVDASLPETLTGHDVLPSPWAEYAAATPGLLDAVAAPDGSFAVHVSKEGLSLVVGGAAGATHPAPGAAIVLAQWATGEDNVARWRAETAGLLKE